MCFALQSIFLKGSKPMAARESSWRVTAVSSLAVGLGLLTAWFDVAAPFGDDTEKGTIVLWLVSSGTFGFLLPHRPWQWALLIGPWVTLAHLARHLFGLPDSINPNTYLTILLLLPISLLVCSLAAYGGSFVRSSVG
jgi:hypothetical protein